MGPLLPIAMGLMELVPSIAGLFKGRDAEQKAGDVLNIAKQVTGIGEPQGAVAALSANPELLQQFQTKLLDYSLAMREADNTQLEIVNQTIRAETASTDGYNRRWRATFGYLVALAWFIMFSGMTAALIIVVIKDLDNLGTIISAIGQMVGATTALWGIALAILGVSVHKRSQDKALAAGVMPAAGIVSNLMGILKK